MTSDEIKPILRKAHKSYDDGRMSEALPIFERVGYLMDRHGIDRIGPYDRASVAQSEAMARAGARAEYEAQCRARRGF